MSQAFEDWVALARSVPVLDAVSMLRGKVKRHGKEYHGPCPAGCAQKDGFIVWPDQNNFLCRPTGETGSVIDLVMHVTGHDFKGACEFLTGTPPPNGRSGGIDETARKRLQKRQEEQARNRERVEQEETRKARYKRQNARGYWNDAQHLSNTPAEQYHKSFYVKQSHLIPSIRFHPSVWHVETRKNHPALICCVTDQNKKFLCIWRIYLDENGQKLQGYNAKMALGAPEGGAVWVGTPDQFNSPYWGIAEGFENAVCGWALYKREMPFFATLSTSGMQNFILPKFVKHAVIFPDGDLPQKKKNGEWGNRPGSWSAEKLSMRLNEENRSHQIQKPAQDGDLKDIWKKAVEDGNVAA